jgi:hypothetical protein
VLLVVIVVGNSGCGMAAKRVFSEVAGASSKAQVVPGTAAGRFSQFEGVKVGAPHSSLGGLVNSRFTGALPTALRDALSTGKDAPFPGGSPILEIDPEVTFYSDKGAFGDLFGSDAYAVVLYTLSSEGAPLGRLQVVTKSAAARTDESDMAKSNAKSLAQFFEQRAKKTGRGKQRD